MTSDQVYTAILHLGDQKNASLLGLNAILFTNFRTISSTNFPAHSVVESVPSLLNGQPFAERQLDEIELATIRLPAVLGCDWYTDTIISSGLLEMF